MKRKIMGIFIVLLLLAIIPSTPIATETPTTYEGIIWLRGLVKVNETENNTVKAFAIRLHYIVSKPLNYTAWGRGISLVHVTFPDRYLMIPIGQFSYVIGISSGELHFEW